MYRLKMVCDNAFFFFLILLLYYRYWALLFLVVHVLDDFETKFLHGHTLNQDELPIYLHLRNLNNLLVCMLILAHLTETVWMEYEVDGLDYVSLVHFELVLLRKKKKNNEKLAEYLARVFFCSGKWSAKTIFAQKCFNFLVFLKWLN